MQYYFLMYRCSHLGDNWSRINTALRLSQKQRVYLRCRYRHCVPIVTEILGLLDIQNTDLHVVDREPPDSELVTRLVESAASYGTAYFRTKLKHQAERTRPVIAYSFDANWRADEKIPLDVEQLLVALQAKLPHVRMMRVGLPMTLPEVVQTLSTAKLLVSVDNGIAHVARSVGVPLFLIQHLLPVTRGFPTHACDYTTVTMQNAAETITAYLEAL